ncbi:MAG TPA: Rossmann-like and DUF2520 domain-containing protein [Gemmatimonadaceae bacterium]|nr:Rossmann-like and DUF2520 domain-containing protein [Gemmatimonadaceae bacterium]
MIVPRVFVLGAGRAGRGLALAFQRAGVPLVGLHGRRSAPEWVVPVTAGPVPAAMRMADVVLIAVRDAQLDEAIREVLDAGPAAGAVVLQASGGTEPGAYRVARAQGIPCGSFHPLLPLADPNLAAERLQGAYVGIDGEPAARTAAARLAGALGAHILEIPPGHRALYHAGAVIASNFVGVLLVLASQTMQAAGVPPDASRGATRALLLAAAENLRTDDAAHALTGPVVRGDVHTVRAHLQALSAHPEIAEVYRTLTRRAVALARAGSTPGETLDAIEALL